MNLGLEGKAALVTGGAAGIGAAIALALAGEGCDVAIVDRCGGGPVESITALGRRGRAVQADVRDHAAATAAIREVVGAFGRLDILVCNAGVRDDAVVWKMTEAQWDDVIAVNLKGAYNYNQAAARLFKQQESGKIVNLASINGLRGKFGQANYAASKAGIIAMSKTLARELGRFNVNVNAIAPGMVATEMTRSLAPEILAAAVDETALGRLATAEDCADLAVFLCSERARHITGAVIQIDGGQYL
jgi:3-oxoacyl-[acyl-carrier protein] reductase